MILDLPAGRSGRFLSRHRRKIYGPEPTEALAVSVAGQPTWRGLAGDDHASPTKQTNGVRSFGLLGPGLVRRFAIAQRSGTLRGTAAELAMTMSTCTSSC